MANWFCKLFWNRVQRALELQSGGVGGEEWVDQGRGGEDVMRAWWDPVAAGGKDEGWYARYESNRMIGKD